MPVHSIQNMIMLKHQGAGIDFSDNNKQKEELSAVKLADLFVKIYKVSNGNPGVALSAWLGGINRVDKDSISIEPTEVPRIDFFNHIKTDGLLIIIQLMIHKQLTLSRLTLCLGLEPNNVDRQLQFLWRMGIVNKLQNDVYEINIYWYPVLSQYLVTKNYI